MILSPRKVYLIRHGQTEWSESDRHTSFTDISLTQEGMNNSELLKKRLKGHTFERVFCSPYKRAKETCEIVGLLKNAEILPDLVEWNYGKYEGLTTKEIHQQDPHWNVFSQGAPDGETIGDVSERATRVLAKLKECKGDVIVFSHGHFLRVLGSRWLGLPPADGRLFALSPTSISILGYERESPVFLRWNDTAHFELS